LRVGMAPPSLLATASRDRTELSVPYHDIPVPTMREMRGLSSHLGAISHANSKDTLTVTPLIDLCLRLACLAYRRNAPTTATGLALHRSPDEPPYGVELQFRAASGAHAVAYLFREPGHQEMYAVVSFKGSTLGSPAAPFLSDWVANLQPGLSGDGDSNARAPFKSGTYPGLVHRGWDDYLSQLMHELRCCMLPDCLPDAARIAWGWPSNERLSLWELLSSRKHCTETLLVGHSMGGALATLAAVQLAQEAAKSKPLLSVTRRPVVRPSIADEDWDTLDGHSPSPEASGENGAGGVSLSASLGEMLKPLSALLISAYSAFQSASSATTEAHDGDPGQLPSSDAFPALVTFGCPVVGDECFVDYQNELVMPHGGLRVYNENDPVASVGYGLLSLASASGASSTKDHGGLPIVLVNDPLTRANPYTNHLRYCIDSEIIASVPCMARYKLPGLLYNPEQNSSHLPATPMLLGPDDPRHEEQSQRFLIAFDFREPSWLGVQDSSQPALSTTSSGQHRALDHSGPRAQGMQSTARAAVLGEATCAPLRASRRGILDSSLGHTPKELF